MGTETFRGLKVPQTEDPELRTFLEGLSRALARLSDGGAAPVGVEPREAKLSAGRMKAGVVNLPVLPEGHITALQIDSGTIGANQGPFVLDGDFVGAPQSTLTLLSDGFRWLEVARAGPVGRVLGCPLIVNEAGSACDPVLRVEGGSDPNLLYLDGANDWVGIGTAAPTRKLTVHDTAAAQLRIENAANGMEFFSDSSGGVAATLEGTTRSLGIDGTPAVPGATTGGKLQIFTGGTAAASIAATDPKTQGLYIQYSGNYTAATLDFGIHRGLFLDFDYTYATSGGFFAPQIKPIEFDINITKSTGTDLGANIRPFAIFLVGGATTKLKGTGGTLDSPVLFDITHSFSTTGLNPANGYVGYAITHSPASAVAQSLTGVRYTVQTKLSGSSNEGSAMTANWVGLTGHTAKGVGQSIIMTPVSTAFSGVGVDVTQVSGTLPSLDQMMTVRGPWHIKTDNSLIAANAGSRPADLSAGHVSFTDGTANLYIEDNAEIDGTAWLDGDLVHAGTNVGFYGATAVPQGAALTSKLTVISHTGPTTPDYALATPTNPGWGFSTQDEFETTMSVIKNLQTRVNDLEARLDSSTGVGLFV